MEAFQASGGPKVSPPEPAPASPPPREPAGVSLASLAAPRPKSRSGLLPLALIAVVAVAGGFLLGRWSTWGSGSEPIRAAGENAPPARETPPRVDPTPAEPVPAGATAELDATPRSVVEQALADPRNAYTIKLVEYENEPRQQRLALEALDYLTKVQGLPACVAVKGSQLFILVGAAPKQVEFDALLALCKTMPGPPPASKAAEFHDAYIEKIDKVFPRNH